MKLILTISKVLACLLISQVTFAAAGSSASNSSRGSGGGSGAGMGITVLPSFTYSSSDVASNQAPILSSTDDITDTSTDLILSLKIGYTFSPGLFLGAAYYSESYNDDNNNKTTATDTKSSAAISGVGASFGYINGGFNFIVTDYLATTATIKQNGAPIEKDKGTNLTVDLGYSFMFGSFGFGPQLTYNSTNFSTVANGSGTTISGASYKQKGFSLGLQFLAMF